MHLEVNGTRLWFDVDGSALVPDGPEMRERPTVVLLREIIDALPAESARLEVIKGAGHFTWKDAPDQYWPLVTGFVTSSVLSSRA